MTTLGIVGFGGMGLYHARQLQHISDATVLVVVDPIAANQERAREFFGNQRVEIFSNIMQALEKVGVAGWIVASSTATHIPITRAILERGGIVLLEKPIAKSLIEAESIAPLVLEDSTNLMMGHTLLWHRQFKTIQELLKSRGRFKAIYASRPRSEDHRVRYPGETPFSLTMVHDLYTLFALVEGREPIRFSATQREHHEGGADVALAQLHWEDGLLASLRADYLIPDSVAAEVSRDELEIAGDDWSMQLPYDKGFIRLSSSGGLTEIPCELPPRNGVNDFYEDAIRNELEHFIALVRGSAVVPIGARYRDACRIQQWIDRFIALAEEGAS